MRSLFNNYRRTLGDYQSILSYAVLGVVGGLSHTIGRCDFCYGGNHCRVLRGRIYSRDIGRCVRFSDQHNTELRTDGIQPLRGASGVEVLQGIVTREAVEQFSLPKI